MVSRAKDRYTQSAMVMIPCSECVDPGESSRKICRFQSRNLTYFTITPNLVLADQAKGYVFDRCKHHEQSRLWKEGSLRLLSVSKTEEGM
jgi:hypothetical protein